ncbi:hypothetical protein BDF14DRAFT_1304455 [Spinellus fusiger]|nr:hypothetical protein BDF14DRAFT_1304455 [Spinellus fusiger]
MDSTPPGLPSIEPIKDDLMQSPLTGESSEKTPAYPSVTKQLPGLLDNGKLNYIESKIRPENHIDVTERVLYFRNFRSVMEKDISSMHQTIEIPVEYQTMIASLVQESDETLSVLSQRINDILSPWERKDQGEQSTRENRRKKGVE